MRTALADQIPEFERRKRAIFEPTYRDLLVLARIDFGREAYADAAKNFEHAQALNTLSAARDGVPQSLFWVVYWGMKRGLFDAHDLDRRAWPLVHDISIPLDSRFDYAWQVCKLENDLGRDRIIAYIERIVQDSTDVTDADQVWYRNRFLMLDALVIKQDPDLALDYRLKTLDENWQANVRTLLDLVEWCLDSGVDILRTAELLDLVRPFAENDDSVRDEVLSLENRF